MHCIINCVRYVSLLASLALQLSHAAPVTAPSESEAPVEAVATNPGESARAEVGPARGGLRGEAPIAAVATGPDTATGQKNLDLLLELQGRGVAVPVGNGKEEASKAERRRLAEGSGAGSAGPVTAKNLLMPNEATEMAEPEHEPGTEARRWSGNLGAQGGGAEAAAGSESSGYKGDLYGVDLRNGPARKLLLLLREYREWVVGAGVAAVLLALATGAASRRRRRG